MLSIRGQAAVESSHADSGAQIKRLVADYAARSLAPKPFVPSRKTPILTVLSSHPKICIASN